MRKIIIVAVILVFLFSCGIIYLNQVILPTKVKVLIVRAIEDTTQKKVSFSSLKFSIFKGLVLRDLSIYDAGNTILKIEEASCAFLILPIFKKQIIIPAIKLKSPEIFVQRRVDNSLNILDPFFRKSPPAAKSNFHLFIYKINLIGGRIHFRDDTLQPVFIKEINNLNLLLRLSLPARVKFNLKFEIPQRPDSPVKVNSSGEYDIPDRELAAKITLKDLWPEAKDLFLESIFAIDGKQVALSKFSGKYINSEFSFSGGIDATDFSGIKADINARLNIDLNDIKEPLKKFKDKIERIKPGGRLQVDVNLKGNINDIKSCAVEAKLSSSSLSVYGLKSQDFLLAYSQQNGIGNIPLMHLSLYNGSIDAIGEINLASQDLPYSLSADIKGIKLEKLKLDTPARDKDISGILQAQAKINGFFGDLYRLSGAGTIIINDGRLWQLNLFKGIGTMLFSSDFTDVVFSEASCGFVVQDKYILTDNLKLKSNLCDISGTAKIGFDSSIDAALNVEVSDEAPLTGTIRDITTAILGAAKRFAVIRITGTLGEPEYEFKPAVADILKSLKDAFSNKAFR